MNKIKQSILITATIAVQFFISCGNNSTTTSKVQTDTVKASNPTKPLSRFLSLKELNDYAAKAELIEPNARIGKPFGKLNYNKVIAYDFEGSGEPYPSIIDTKGRFVPVVVKQMALTQRQIDVLLSTLAKKSSYGENTAFCFEPHFAIVFFKDDKVVNQINVCRNCNRLHSTIEIPAQSHKKVNKGTEDEYALVGLTDAGWKAIVDLSTELSFRYGKMKGSKERIR
ncbi:MAG: hypothetical protein REI64_11865 [Pedobacter sp.]|uniref:hypothetical protein n=1 Tax=Bacteroidota TaxID=976 RepID=UPI002809CA49|nr:hypothetical protein [Pedobacter sp.]MDQ8005488.1 hypothetical protein [Pedobacter sp.]